MATDFTNLAEASLEPNWEAIFAEVNGWRGACMHHFSTVEMAVTETLLTLSEVSRQGTVVRLRQLIGQRFEDLAAVVGPNGEFAGAGQSAYAGLSRYRDDHEGFRAILCHGTIKITIDQSGHWTLIIRTLSIRSRQPERGLLVIDRAEALSRLAALKVESQKLASVLGQLRKAVAA